MATLTLRSVKGSPLTNSEVDGNFTALNTELATKLTATDYNAADVLTKLKTVDGAGSGLDADLIDGITSALLARVTAGGLLTAGAGIQMVLDCREGAAI